MVGETTVLRGGKSARRGESLFFIFAQNCHSSVKFRNASLKKISSSMGLLNKFKLYGAFYLLCQTISMLQFNYINV
jgi:hypothetical protein